MQDAECRHFSAINFSAFYFPGANLPEFRLQTWVAGEARAGKLLALGSAVLLTSVFAFLPADSDVQVEGIHLCCGSCVDAVTDALKAIDGVTSIDVDREAGTVTLNGSDIVHTAALNALNKGGFYGKIAE